MPRMAVCNTEILPFHKAYNTAKYVSQASFLCEYVHTRFILVAVAWVKLQLRWTQQDI